MNMKWAFLFLITFTFLGNVRAAEQAIELEPEQDPIAAQRVWAGLNLNYVPFSFPNYQWAGTGQVDRSGKGFHLGLEFIALDEPFGKLGVGTGTGLFILKNVDLGGVHGSLYAIPVEAHLSYYLEVFQNQVLVPFVKYGPTYYAVRQQTFGLPDINVSTWTMDLIVGGEFLLNVIDPKSASSLLRSVGIEKSYLSFEYVTSRYFHGDPQSDLTTDLYRLGLRFEM